MTVKAMQLVFFLFILVKMAECDDVFELVNSSVQLDLQKDVNFTSLYWTFNKNVNIAFINPYSPEVFGGYKDRAEVNQKTNSLTLKNLQKSDSGVYEGETFGEFRETVATYNLYVMDPVEEPILNHSFQKNNKTCNVTLTCEAHDLSVTSHCYSNNCDREEIKSGFLSVSLYVSESFIICNHSNPVSWKNTTVEIKHVEKLCLFEDKNIFKPCKNKIVLPVIIVVVIIIIIISIIITGIFIRKKKTTDIETLNKEGQNWPNEMLNSHESPSTVYSMAGMPGQAFSEDKNPISSENQEEETNHDTGNSPQTIYSTVSKPGKPA